VSQDVREVFGHFPLALVTPAIAILITTGSLVVRTARAIDGASAHPVLHRSFSFPFTSRNWRRRRSASMAVLRQNSIRPGFSTTSQAALRNANQGQKQSAKDISAPMNRDRSQNVFTVHDFVLCCLVGEPEKVAKNKATESKAVKRLSLNRGSSSIYPKYPNEYEPRTRESRWHTGCPIQYWSRPRP